MASNGPINSLGTRGKTISVDAAKIRKSLTSSLVTAARTKPCMGSLAVKRMAAVTAKLAAKDGVVMAKPPNIAVKTSVISVVKPGCSLTLTT